RAHARPRALAALQNIVFAELQWIEVELLRQNIALAFFRPDRLRGTDGSKTSCGDCIGVERIGFHAEIWEAVRANDSIRSFFCDARSDHRVRAVVEIHRAIAGDNRTVAPGCRSNAAVHCQSSRG